MSIVKCKKHGRQESLTGCCPLCLAEEVQAKRQARREVVQERMALRKRLAAYCR